MIEVKNLSYTYAWSEHRALTDINLIIPDGEIAAIIGHTGSGKSTLIQNLNGLLKPSSGQILIDGEDISGLKSRDICQKAGLVFQYPENQLFEETVYKDIAFGLKNIGLDAEKTEERVLSAADMVGLDRDSLSKSPFELSGGEMRRAAVAGVIAMKPKILILDEPAAGLDPKGRDTMFDMIKRLHGGRKDMTVIFVSHSMEDAARLANHIIVMNNGKIEMNGSVSEVFSKAERLKEIGLGVPKITEIMQKLRSLGYDVLEEVYTVKTAAAEIKRLLEAGNV